MENSKKNNKVFCFLIFGFTFFNVLSNPICYAQVGINTTTPSDKAILDITSSDKGVLIPRLTTIQKNAINPNATTDKGLQVFDTDTNTVWYWNGIEWIENSGKNIYNSDGTLIANRVITQGNNTLSFQSNSTNGFSIDGTTLSVDAANNRLGIGTTTPTETVDVTGNIKFSAALMPNNSAGTDGQVLTSSGSNASPTWTTIVPTSAIFYLATASVPTGYLECNGQAVNRVTYANLFAAIGTTYGAGDGVTTFNIPDLRGVFIRTWDHGKGIDSGRNIGTNQLDALQNITGNFQGAGNFANGAFADSNNVSSWLQYGAGYNDISNYNFDASRVARTANETRPRNIALMAVIKL